MYELTNAIFQSEEPIQKSKLCQFQLRWHNTDLEASSTKWSWCFLLTQQMDSSVSRMRHIYLRFDLREIQSEIELQVTVIQIPFFLIFTTNDDIKISQGCNFYSTVMGYIFQFCIYKKANVKCKKNDFDLFKENALLGEGMLEDPMTRTMCLPNSPQSRH